MSLKGSASGNALRGKINLLDTLHGKSAYEIALIHGFKGTEEEWLASLKGEPGDFRISKTYPSVAAMNAGFATDGVPVNGFVLINTGNVDDEDNAKLYVKLEDRYSYLADLSGLRGYTPQIGVDYFTEGDIESIISDVINRLPMAEGSGF